MENTSTVAPEQNPMAVYMNQLSSCEIYLREGQYRRILENINLSIHKGEVWGLNGKSLLEIKLLLEIMANIKPYYDGRCVLLEIGMMRRKRIILPHVFYIGTVNMIYNNMNVLEYLMFATANSKIEVVKRQKQLLKLLIDIGLGNISLTPIHTLPSEFRVIVILLTAYFSSSELIIFNVPELKYNNQQITPMKNIARLISDSGKTLVFSSIDSALIQEICTHTAYLINGSIVFSGTISEFCEEYDDIILTISDQQPYLIMESMQKALPQYKYKVSDDRLIISKPSTDSRVNVESIYNVIFKMGLNPDRVRMNTKTVKNAVEGILRKYDL